MPAGVERQAGSLSAETGKMSVFRRACMTLLYRHDCSVLRRCKIGVLSHSHLIDLHTGVAQTPDHLMRVFDCECIAIVIEVNPRLTRAAVADLCGPFRELII